MKYKNGTRIKHSAYQTFLLNSALLRCGRTGLSGFGY